MADQDEPWAAAGAWASERPAHAVARARGVAAALAVAAVLALVWFAGNALLLLFAGVLLGVFLRALSDRLRDATGLPDRWALAAVMAVLGGTLAVTGWFLAPRVVGESARFLDALPDALSWAAEYLRQYEWGRRLLEAPAAAGSGAAVVPMAVGKAAGAASAVATWAVSAVVVLFVGFFTALEPKAYTDGLVTLVPPARRPRAEQLVGELGHIFRRWMVARVLSMLLVGVPFGVGLWLLGVPFALPVGLLAVVLQVVPYLGPAAAAAPALLLAVGVGPGTAWAVLGLYLAIQFVETYLVTPLLVQQAVAVPPATAIAAVVLAGALFGPLGMALADPAAAAARVLLRRLYVEDTLGEPAPDDGLGTGDEGA